MKILKIENTELKIFGSDIDEKVIEETIEMIKGSPTLFGGETVVLMPDAHSTGSTPVGFTCTGRNGLIAPDLISADVSCGMSSLFIENYVPSKKALKTLSYFIRDIIPIQRTIDHETGKLTDKGTLGSGNHFVEIGTDGTDTLITVHSGSRNYGGKLYKRMKDKAIAYNKGMSKEEFKEELAKQKVGVPNEDIPALIEKLKSQNKKDLIPSMPITDEIKQAYLDAHSFAMNSRGIMLNNVYKALSSLEEVPNEYWSYHCGHNYIDFYGEEVVTRKGSIGAEDGKIVIIPLNMRDGIIVGTSTNTQALNNSLPHGAGRKKSRTAFRKEFSLEEYKKEMEGIVAPTLSEATLDEAPSAYKDADTIIEDIALHIEDMRIFKPIFNYKGE